MLKKKKNKTNVKKKIRLNKVLKLKNKIKKKVEM